MPSLNFLLAALIAGSFGASVLLLVVAVRGTVLDPTRPPNRLQALLDRPRSPLLTLRLAGGVVLAILVFVVTRWPVAALGLGGLLAFYPALLGGSRDEQQQIVRLEAVVTWCEALRDTTTGHAGLEQAIPATAENAAPPIRPALLRLTGQLRSKVPLEQALQDLAEQLHHSADLIIAALQMNVATRGDGLVGVLTNLAVAGREELDLRRKITAGRAGDRRAVALMLMIVLAVATFLVVFSQSYTAPYRTVGGQVALAIVMGLFTTSFVWIRKLASAKPVTPFLPQAGQAIDPMEQRIISALTGGPAPSGPPASERTGRAARRAKASTR